MVAIYGLAMGRATDKNRRATANMQLNQLTGPHLILSQLTVIIGTLIIITIYITVDELSSILSVNCLQFTDMYFEDSSPTKLKN